MIWLALMGCNGFDEDVFVEEFDRLACERTEQCNDTRNDPDDAAECFVYPEPADTTCFDDGAAAQCLFALRTAVCLDAAGAPAFPIALPAACGCAFPCNQPEAACNGLPE